MASELTAMRAERELYVLRSHLEDLQHDDWQLRVRSLKALSTIRRTKEFSEEAVPMILSCCSDDHSIVRQAAIPLLGDLSSASPAILATAVQILGREAESEIKAAVYALGKIGPDALETLPNLLFIISSESPKHTVEIKKATSWAISMFGPDSVPEILVEMQTGRAASLVYLLPALGNMGPIATPALPTIISCLTRPEASIRLEAAKALGNLRAAPDVIGAIPDLQAVLHDPDPDVRWAAAEALRKIGTEEAMAAWATYSEIPSTDAYVQQLANDDKAVRLHAAEQLYTVLTPESAFDVTAFGKALRDTYYKIPIALCEAYAKLEEKGAVLGPALAELLQHSESSVRAAALTTLGKVQAEDQTEQIIACLQDSDKEVRLAAGLALELLGTDAASRALKKFKWE